MSKPTILTVDDDPQVLAAVRRDLRGRYGAEYRIVSAESGREALTAARELSLRGDAIALLLVDQRMPEQSGTEFLREVATIHPSSKKVLLTAYADTEAAISSINDIGLDYYLMKPWDPPEEHLYPVVDDLLDVWQASNRPAWDGIRILGPRWSRLVHAIKDFFARNQVPYRWLDAETSDEAKALLASAGDVALPVVVFPDGEVVARPSTAELADRIGLKTDASLPFYDLVIIGGGPAGLASAVYAASEGLNVVLIERGATGGQAGGTSRIENYLGFPKGISGADLARRATTQAQRLGAEIITAAEVTSVHAEDPYKIVVLDNGAELSCHALVIATGMTIRNLDVPGYERFNGAGVYYGAAVSEATAMQGQHVVVVGGANSAGQGAMLLAEHAKNVTIVVRASSLGTKMSQYLVDQISTTDNIDVLLHTEVRDVNGAETVERVLVEDNRSGDMHEIEVAAVFIFAGAEPHSKVVADVVERSESGFIYTGQDLYRSGAWPKSWPLDRQPFLLETSVPGIFAAGDVRHGAMRRVASAVGQGSVAISMVHRYLASV